MERESRLAVLFSKLLENACTSDEVDELLDILSAEGRDPAVLKLVYEQLAVPEVPEETSDIVRRRLGERLGLILATDTGIDIPHTDKNEAANEDVSPFPSRSRGKVFFVHFRRFAAAILLILVGLIAARLFFTSRKAEKTVPPSPPLVKNDVQPGYSKAILTLANGQKIVLDSVGNGILAEQGTTNVLKQGSGQLAYHASAEKAAEIVYNTLTTPAGGQYRLILPDGSRVWLDASSSIVYPTAFNAKERTVEISGQAYFEIAKNEKQPFIVRSGTTRIQVLGTGFNVNAYGDETTIKTTLLEGKVRVSTGNNAEVLIPGQQARSTHNEIVEVLTADTEQAVAWKNGFFSFRHADIQTVMRQLCRWYDVSVQYEGGVGSKESFSGEIGRNLSLSDVLNGLQLARIHYRIEADKKLVILQ